MGNIRSRLVRKVRMFNIDTRTEKILEKEKPTPAPSFAATKKQMQVAQELNPDFMKDHYSKDPNLNTRLKEVYVSSHDETIKRQESTRSLPQNRAEVQPLEYGVYEPSHIPPGKCSLKQALTFLHDYKVDPVNNNVEKIAEKFALDQEVVGNIVKHYQILNLKLPESLQEMTEEMKSVCSTTKQLDAYAGIKDLVDRYNLAKHNQANKKDDKTD